MKNLFKISLFVMLLSMSVSVEAADYLDVKVTNNQVLTVELENVEKGAILFLRDKNGEILFRDDLFLKGSYKKSLSLEEVPNGIYFLNLESENHLRTTMITKSATGISINGNASKIVFKPHYKVEDKNVRVFLTNPEGKKVIVNVFDAEGMLVGTINAADVDLRKTFDFSQVPPGEYTIEVSFENYNFFRKVVMA